MNKENINLVAYCGLYCQKCYKMLVSNAAEFLKNTLENTHIYGTLHEPSSKFKDELNNLVLLRCPKLCRERGGNPNCIIRTCCIEKNIVGCWDCDEFQTCKNLKEQFINNIKKIKKLGIEGFILQLK